MTATAHQQRVIAVFREAFTEASTVVGGSVYTSQDVKGLSDVAADAPLVAALHLCGSDETIQLGPAEHRFLAQSCFKPLTFAMALESGLGQAVAAAVASIGDKPLGTLALAPDGRALNPLINSERWWCSSCSRALTEEEVMLVPYARRRAAPVGACFDDEAVAATSPTRWQPRAEQPARERRRAARPRMRSRGPCATTRRWMPADRCRRAGALRRAAGAASAATAAATAARRVFPPRARAPPARRDAPRRHVRGEGEWAAAVGLPAKSGVSGGVVCPPRRGWPLRAAGTHRRRGQLGGGDDAAPPDGGEAARAERVPWLASACVAGE